MEKLNANRMESKCEYLSSVAKIDLHRHLDGSLRLESIIDEARIQGIYIGDNIDDIRNKVTAAEREDSLLDYLKCFDIPLKLMQRESAIERFTYDFFEDAHKEGLVYVEVRFAPILHTRMGLDLKTIIKSVKAGMDKACEKYGIEGNIILSCMKNFSEEDAIATIEAGKEFIGKGVVDRKSVV